MSPFHTVAQKYYLTRTIGIVRHEAYRVLQFGCLPMRKLVRTWRKYVASIRTFYRFLPNRGKVIEILQAPGIGQCENQFNFEVSGYQDNDDKHDNSDYLLHDEFSIQLPCFATSSG